MAADAGNRQDGFLSGFAKSMSAALGGWVVTGVIAVLAVKLVDAADGWFHPDVERAKKAKEQAELVVKFLPFLDQKGGHAGDAAVATLYYLRDQTGLDDALARGITEALKSKVAAADAESAVQAAVVVEAAQRESLLAAQLAPAAATAASQASLQAQAQSLNAIVAGAKPRLYVQVPRGDEGVESRLDSLLPALKAAGYLVPPVERVDGARFPRATQVRYFNEADKAAADRAVEQLKQQGVAAVVQRVRLSAPLGQLELWLAASAR